MIQLNSPDVSSMNEYDIGEEEGGGLTREEEYL